MRELELYMKGSVPMESASALIEEKIKELGDWRRVPRPLLLFFFLRPYRN